MADISQFRHSTEKDTPLLPRIDHSQQSEIKHRFSSDSFVNLAGAKYSIGLVYACLFSIYHAERWKSWHEFTVQFSILFSTVVSPSATAPFFPIHLPSSSQQPAATLPSVTLHYLPLRNVEDASFHSGARKISPAVSLAPTQAPDSWNSATILNCYDAFGNFSHVLSMIRDSRFESNCKFRDTVDIVHYKSRANANSLLNAAQIKELLSL